jgi:hypothetical protein
MRHIHTRRRSWACPPAQAFLLCSLAAALLPRLCRRRPRCSKLLCAESFPALPPRPRSSPQDNETKMFYEIVIAPGYTPEGLEILKGACRVHRAGRRNPVRSYSVHVHACAVAFPWGVARWLLADPSICLPRRAISHSPCTPAIPSHPFAHSFTVPHHSFTRRLHTPSSQASPRTCASWRPRPARPAGCRCARWAGRRGREGGRARKEGARGREVEGRGRWATQGQQQLQLGERDDGREVVAAPGGLGVKRTGKAKAPLATSSSTTCVPEPVQLRVSSCVSVYDLVCVWPCLCLTVSVYDRVCVWPCACAQVAGGWLVQDADSLQPEGITFTVVSATQPTAQQLEDLKFAWR